MSQELHERGNHVVWTGGPGSRAGYQRSQKRAGSSDPALHERVFAVLADGLRPRG